MIFQISHHLQFGPITICAVVVAAGGLFVVIRTLISAKSIREQSRTEETAFRNMLLGSISGRMHPIIMQLYEILAELRTREVPADICMEFETALERLMSHQTAMADFLDADNDSFDKHGESIAVRDLLETIIVERTPLYRKKGVVVHLSCEDRELRSPGPGLYTRIAIESVIDNAIDCSSNGKEILVLARKELGVLIIEVADEGPHLSIRSRNLLRQTTVARSLSATDRRVRRLIFARRLLRALGGELFVTTSGSAGSVIRAELPTTD